MARGRGGRGGQPPVRGFRPGKEPPQVRKRRAREQLGDEANWAQKRLVDALAERTPDESRAMMRRWRVALLVATILLVVAGALLYMWSLVAGIIVHLLAVVVFFFWLRLHRQREDFEAMANLVSGGRRK